MVLAFKTVVDLWRERLAELDERNNSGQPAGWYCVIERRVLAFLVRRHEGGAPPSGAAPLDEASASASDQLQMDTDVRRRLEPVWPESPAGRRGFRSEEELAALDQDVYRRLEFRRRTAARVSFLLMALLCVVIFCVSMYFIVFVLGVE